MIITLINNLPLRIKKTVRDREREMEYNNLF